MFIEQPDFKLEADSPNNMLWNLSFRKVINKGKENEREEYGIPLYGLTLEYALCLIAHYRVMSKNPDSITLQKYIEDYKAAKEEIANLCRQ